MRKLFDGVRNCFETFIDQRDDLIMLSCCSDNDAAIVLKLLRDVEQGAGTDVFFMCTDRFADARTFANAAREQFLNEHEAACKTLVGEGLNPLTPIPDNLRDTSSNPASQL